MPDRILETFLRRNCEEGLALAAASDLLALIPAPEDPPTKYIASYACTGLVRRSDGSIVESNQFAVGIWFNENYLRGPVEPLQVVTWLGPQSVFHPNISAVAPVICIGRLAAGTPLISILYQVWDIITYQKWTAHDGLNDAACQWARNNQRRFPIDRRPLKWSDPKKQAAGNGGR